LWREVFRPAEGGDGRELGLQVWFATAGSINKCRQCVLRDSVSAGERLG
jgi:hypothetical protein